MKIGAIYSASDKSMYDALNQKNVTNSDLRQLFLSRGILVSPNSARKNLASHFARIFHDFDDYQTLARLFGAGATRDKFSTLKLKTDAEVADLQTAAIDIKSKLEEEGAVVKVFSTSGNRMDIEVKYPKVSFNKSEFRQVTQKTARITFFKEDDGFSVHSTDVDDVSEWINEVAKQIKENSGKDIKFDEVELPPTFDSKKKSLFLKNLINSMDGFAAENVTDVYVSKPKGWSRDSQEEIRIEKASLRGLGVLYSGELKALEENHGFYVSRIVWTAKTKQLDTDLYEFEAQFSQADECKGFAYLARGFYKYLSTGVFNTTRTGLTHEDEIKYGKLIEKAARKVLLNLQGEADGQA